MIIVDESIDQMNIASLQAVWTPRIDDFQPPPRGRVELLVEEKTSTIVVLLGKRGVLNIGVPQKPSKKPKGVRISVSSRDLFFVVLHWDPILGTPPEKKNTVEYSARCSANLGFEKPGSPCRTDQSQFISVCFKRCRVEVVPKW